MYTKGNNGDCNLKFQEKKKGAAALLKVFQSWWTE